MSQAFRGRPPGRADLAGLAQRLAAGAGVPAGIFPKPALGLSPGGAAARRRLCRATRRLRFILHELRLAVRGTAWHERRSPSGAGLRNSWRGAPRLPRTSSNASACWEAGKLIGASAPPTGRRGEAPAGAMDVVRSLRAAVRRLCPDARWSGRRVSHLPGGAVQPVERVRLVRAPGKRQRSSCRAAAPTEVMPTAVPPTMPRVARAEKRARAGRTRLPPR